MIFFFHEPKCSSQLENTDGLDPVDSEDKKRFAEGTDREIWNQADQQRKLKFSFFVVQSNTSKSTLQPLNPLLR
jgi:hypothetical protein